MNSALLQAYSSTIYSRKRYTQCYKIMNLINNLSFFNTKINMYVIIIPLVSYIFNSAIHSLFANMFDH